MERVKTHQESIEEIIAGATYSKLTINEKINVKATLQPRSYAEALEQRTICRPIMSRVVNGNPYRFTGDFSRLPVQTGKGYAV